MKSGGAKNEKSTIHSLRRLHVQTPQQIGDLQTFANHRYTQQGLRNGALLQGLRRKVVFRCYANNIAFVRACVAPKSTHKKVGVSRPFCEFRNVITLSYNKQVNCSLTACIACETRRTTIILYLSIRISYIFNDCNIAIKLYSPRRIFRD